MLKQILTTTEAAKMLFVAPDTVLKWVKAGKIKSYRTPGGHSRIPIDSVTALLTEQHNDIVRPEPKSERSYQYCWQYPAAGKKNQNDCSDCLSYICRVKRCYQLRNMIDGIGCIRIGCDVLCEVCDYYKTVSGQVLSVVIMSENRRTLYDRSKLNFNPDMKIEFVEDEYECSFLIEKFRPDYIIIDYSMEHNRIWAFCKHLVDDPRLPFARIIFTSEGMDEPIFCAKEIFGWIKKPLSVENIREYIHRM